MIAIIICAVALLIIILAASSSESTSKKQPTKRRITYEKVRHSNEDGTYFTCEVRGTYYRTSSEIERARNLDIDEPLLLSKEPDNPRDMYAIKIQTMDGYNIGYLPKEYARCLNKHMDAFVDCFVDRVVDSNAAPYVYIRVFFNKKTTVHYMEMVKDPYKRQHYDSIQDWETSMNENPNDFYIVYRYVEALRNAGQWIEAAEVMKKMYKEFDLAGWEYLESQAIFIYEMAEASKRTILHDELILKQAEGKRLFEKKEYEKALELFKECLPLKQQLVPRNICKCYEKLGMQEELYDFVIEILKEEWITVNNRVLLEKYIQ